MLVNWSKMRSAMASVIAIDEEANRYEIVVRCEIEKTSYG